jgi:membrane-associated protease RseP (regulator of RpoE activity)
MGAATVAGVLLPLLAQTLVRWAMARRFILRDRWRLLIPIGGSIAVATASQMRPRRRAAVLGAGLAAVYLVVALGVFAYFHWVGQYSDHTYYRVDAINPSSPAQGVLQTGDLIVDLEGQPLEASAPLSALVDEAGGRPLAIGIERSGRREIATVTPRFDEASGRHRIGIEIAPERVRAPLSVGQAAGRAIVFPFSHGRVVLRYAWSTLSVEEEKEVDFVGPVGIIVLTAPAPGVEVGVVLAVCVFILLLAADLVLLLLIALRRR